MPSSKLISNISSLVKIIGNNSVFEMIINTDSRKFNKGETFVALGGESFDGRKYIESVLDRGAKAVIFVCDNEYTLKLVEWHKNFPDVTFVCVLDSLKFLQSLASKHISSWKQVDHNRKIIGITGSNGKTTHKEMMSFILDRLYPEKILATQGNFNNHIGVPLTIFGINERHTIAVIEMGMNHMGEIAELTAIAHPEHGMITNVGLAHIEFMKNIENIYKEKKELYESVLINSKGNGIFVVPADDLYLATLPKSPGLYTYGENIGDVVIKIESPQIEILINDKKLLITNKNIQEKHNLKNLAGVTIFLLKLFPDKEAEILKAAGSYTHPKMNRSQWVDNIFLDAYNANPSSMKISIDSFVETMKSKQISLDDCYFVVGDMNELGEFAPLQHKEMAMHFKNIGIKNITFIGRYREYYLDGFSHPTSSFLTKEEFYQDFQKIRKEFRFLFVKASRSLQLESLLTIV